MQAVVDPCLPPALIAAGARHLMLALTSRFRLAGMKYHLEAVAALMRRGGLATISLVHAETRLSSTRATHSPQVASMRIQRRAPTLRPFLATWETWAAHLEVAWRPGRVTT